MTHFSRMIAAFVAAGLCGTASAQISGKVILKGNPPEMRQIKEVASNPQCAALHKDPVYEDTVLVGDKGELANVIVFIQESKAGELEGRTLTAPAKLKQKGCMYEPHVLAVQIGQPVIVSNGDAFLHNVHGMVTANKPFNFIQLNVGENKLEPFTAEETFQIKCDVHPWMKSVVRVFSHPYFEVTGEDGKFVINTGGLKDGSYSVRAWHEVYKESLPQTVEVKGGKASHDIEFVFAAEAKAPPAK